MNMMESAPLPWEERSANHIAIVYDALPVAVAESLPVGTGRCRIG